MGCAFQRTGGQPDEPGWVVCRVLYMVILLAVGIQSGVYVQQRFLRDRFKLVPFG